MSPSEKGTKVSDQWLREVAKGGFITLNEETDEAKVETLTVDGPSIRAAEAQGLLYQSHRACAGRIQYHATPALARRFRRTPGVAPEAADHASDPGGPARRNRRVVRRGR